MRGQPGHGITHDRTPDCHEFPWHGYMDDLTTERSFGSLVCLACIFDVLAMVFFYNQAL